MDLRGYIKHFGNKTFSEFAFNEVDAMVFSFLSYAHWELYAPKVENPNEKPFTFRYIIEERIKPLAKDIPEEKLERKVLSLVAKSKRYKNCKVKYVSNIVDIRKKEKFFALTYDIPYTNDFVCFRGTDLSMLAWQENFIQGLDIITYSQMDSLYYLLKVSKLIEGKFCIGGHSKGGNLSVYSAMNAPNKIQDRIIKIFSFDGNGFYKKDVFEEESYKRIEPKIVQFFPRDSFVGMVFYTPKDYKVVQSKNFSFFQHFITSWKINKDGTLKFKNKRTYMSYVRHRALKLWVECADKDTKSLTVDSLVSFLGGVDNDINFYLKHPGKIGKTIFSWNKKFTKEQKKLIGKWTRQLIKAYISSFFYCLKKKNRLSED